MKALWQVQTLSVLEQFYMYVVWLNNDEWKLYI